MPITKGEAERRIHPRVSARVEVHFSDAKDAARRLKAYSLNFSAGGLCVLTERPYEVGAPLELTLRVHNETYELQGVVAWLRGGAVGIRFVELSQEDQRRLARLVAALKA
jgi:uncharacterized protein (TIGR02266 family)